MPSPNAYTLITSQLPIEQWHDYIGDPNVTDAILDRIVHNAQKICLTADESMRNPESRRIKKTSSTPTEID